MKWKSFGAEPPAACAATGLAGLAVDLSAAGALVMLACGTSLAIMAGNSAEVLTAESPAAAAPDCLFLKFCALDGLATRCCEVLTGTADAFAAEMPTAGGNLPT